MNARQRRTLLRWWRRNLEDPEMTIEDALQADRQDADRTRHFRAERNRDRQITRSRHATKRANRGLFKWVELGPSAAEAGYSEMVRDYEAKHRRRVAETLLIPASD